LLSPFLPLHLSSLPPAVSLKKNSDLQEKLTKQEHFFEKNTLPRHISFLDSQYFARISLFSLVWIFAIALLLSPSFHFLLPFLLLY
jgi:hypothetical protein